MTLDDMNGIEIRPYAAGFPGQRLDDAPLRRFAVQRIVGGAVVQRHDQYRTLVEAERAADLVAAGYHGRCCACWGPCLPPTGDADPLCEECARG